MTQEFVNYNQALALKELGFDEPCLGYYKDMKGEKVLLYDSMDFDGECNTPLYQQVFRWFRDKYDLWFRPDYYDEMREYDYQGSIHQLGRHSSLITLGNCKTVEELEAKCIDKLIEIVKNK